MDADRINEAVVTSIRESAMPGVDRQKLIDRYGEIEGSAVADRVIAIVREAVAMPIDWGDMTLAEGSTTSWADSASCIPNYRPKRWRKSVDASAGIFDEPVRAIDVDAQKATATERLAAARSVVFDASSSLRRSSVA